MNRMYKVLMAATAITCGMIVHAQDKIIRPDINYAGTPRTVVIGSIAVSGVQGCEDHTLSGIPGLSVGQTTTVPGNDTTDAVERYWKHGLFSDVSISTDSTVGNKIYLNIYLQTLPRVSEINYIELKKPEREAMETKLGLLKGGQVTLNTISRAKFLAKKHFDDKRPSNADIGIIQRDGVPNKNNVVLDVIADKKAKIRVRHIGIIDNEVLSDKKIKDSLFIKGTFKKTHEPGKFGNILKSKKYTPERWKEDKRNFIKEYNEHEFHDTVILEDSVWNVDDKHVNISVKADEGTKYYLRNITRVDNTVYATDYLNALLSMEKGDVYNQTLMPKRLTEDDDAVGNKYQNNDYLFYSLQPTEVSIVGGSTDLEMCITENQQVRLNHVCINGNDRLYENVVRCELKTKPDDLFSKGVLMRSARELASTGHFDPERVNPDVKPDSENGAVDINWNPEQKSNDQVEFSLGWGQNGLTERVGLELNNFSIRNLFNKNSERRGILPTGDGEVSSLGAQTNGRFYQSYNMNYSTNWFGGKQPTRFSVGAYLSKPTDVSTNSYNNSWCNNHVNYMCGYGSYVYNNYENYLDPDTYIKMFGASLGWGKRLRWPDDYFMLSVQLAYIRYMLKNWEYFLVTTGNASNLNLNLSISRTSTDNQLYPRRGLEFAALVSPTSSRSKWDKKDYEDLALNRQPSTFLAEQQGRYKWVEYRKWRSKAKTYTVLSGGQKCFVLMTRVELGLLGSYNRFKKSPSEIYYVGGDGMSGYSIGYVEETTRLRGYENGSLTPYGYEGYAYNRMSLELRYPLLLGNTTIYGLGLTEAGNAWDDTRKFNPFDIKRSAGLGVRIFLPMVGSMGIDWVYGSDKVFGRKGGNQFHFILDQEF